MYIYIYIYFNLISFFYFSIFLNEYLSFSLKITDISNVIDENVKAKKKRFDHKIKSHE